MHIHLTPNQIEYFWNRVTKTDSCWIWDGPISGKGGYGLFRWRQNKKCVGTSAHRVAWVITNGPVPDGLEVCHNCPDGDNRRCVNPDHLWLGTRSQNTLDTIAKGRYHLNIPPVRTGKDNSNSKLTEDAVRYIRDTYMPGAISQQCLADQFGVSQFVISCVLRRKTWKHVV